MKQLISDLQVIVFIVKISIFAGIITAIVSSGFELVAFRNKKKKAKEFQIYYNWLFKEQAPPSIPQAENAAIKFVKFHFQLEGKTVETDAHMFQRGEGFNYLVIVSASTETCEREFPIYIDVENRQVSLVVL